MKEILHYCDSCGKCFEDELKANPGSWNVFANTAIENDGDLYLCDKCMLNIVLCDLKENGWELGMNSKALLKSYIRNFNNTKYIKSFCSYYNKLKKNCEND